MDDDIRTLEKMRDDLLRQVSALDFAIRTLRHIRADLMPTDHAPDPMPTDHAPDPMPLDLVLPRRLPRWKKATTLTDEQLAAVPDYNPERGGIRIDD